MLALLKNGVQNRVTFEKIILTICKRQEVINLLLALFFISFLAQNLAIVPNITKFYRTELIRFDQDSAFVLVIFYK
jgi:hypothetical protein